MIVLTGWVLVPFLPFLAAAITRPRVRAQYPASLAQMTGHPRDLARARAIAHAVRKLAPLACAPQQIGDLHALRQLLLYRSCVFRASMRRAVGCQIYGGRLWKTSLAASTWWTPTRSSCTAARASALWPTRPDPRTA
jgi:hypothetical protein